MCAGDIAAAGSTTPGVPPPRASVKRRPSSRSAGRPCPRGSGSLAPRHRRHAADCSLSVGPAVCTALHSASRADSSGGEDAAVSTHSPLVWSTRKTRSGSGEYTT